MQMTDSDHLSTPTDMVELLRDLAKIMGDVETLPDAVQQRFWDDVSHNIAAAPAEDFHLAGGLGTRSVTVLYNILVSMCGPKLTEMVSGMAKEHYEQLIEQMRAMAHCAWDVFLDQRFDQTKGSLIASVTLRDNAQVGYGTLKRADGDAGLLMLTDAQLAADKERYFLSKDILMVEVARSSAPDAACAEVVKMACVETVKLPDDLDELRAEFQRLTVGVRRLHALVDQTDPRDPLGVALTRAGLARMPAVP